MRLKPTDDGAHVGMLASMRWQTLVDDEPRECGHLVVSAESMAALIERGAPRDGWPEHDRSEAAYDRVTWVCAAAMLDAYRYDPLVGLIRDVCELWFLVTARDGWAWIAEGPSSPSLFQWG